MDAQFGKLKAVNRFQGMKTLRTFISQDRELSYQSGQTVSNLLDKVGCATKEVTEMEDQEDL